MKKVFSLSLLIVLFLFSFSVSVQSQAKSLNKETPKIVTVSSNEVIDKDFFTAAGEIVEISGTVNGDVYVAGGQVLIDGVVMGDLLVAGGVVVVSGDINQDVRVAGGQLSISGNVGRNLTVFGGSTEITQNASVKGGLFAVGGNISLLAPIGSDVWIAAGNLTLSNSVGGDVEAYVGNLRLTSKAKVSGNLTYTSETLATIDDGALIAGEIIRHKPPVEFTTGNFEKSMNQLAKAFVKIRIVAGIFSFIAATIVGLIMLKLFPRFTKSTTEVLSKKAWMSLVVGFLALVFTPLAVIMLLLTVVGIPLALILLVFYPIYIYLAKIYVAYFVGLNLSDRWNLKVSDNWALIFGLALFYVVQAIPYFGWLISLAAVLFGLGASLLSDRAFYTAARKKNLL